MGFNAKVVENMELKSAGKNIYRTLPVVLGAVNPQIDQKILSYSIFKLSKKYNVLNSIY